MSISSAQTIAFWCCFPCRLLIAIVFCLPSCGKSCRFLESDKNPAKEKARKIATAANDAPNVITGKNLMNKDAFNKIKSLEIPKVWDPMQNFGDSQREKDSANAIILITGSNEPVQDNPMRAYLNTLEEKIFNVLDENDLGSLKSDEDFSEDEIEFIGAELQKAIFSRLPSAEEFHRAAKGHKEPEYLDEMLAGALKKIVTQNFIESCLGSIGDELQKQRDARILVQSKQNVLFSQGAERVNVREHKEETGNDTGIKISM